MFNENGYNENGETAYMLKGWGNNVQNCNVPVDRSIIVSDKVHEYEWDLIQAGISMGQLGLDQNKNTFHMCGKWWWIEFVNAEDAIAFKLLWEQ